MMPGTESSKTRKAELSQYKMAFPDDANATGPRRGRGKTAYAVSAGGVAVAIDPYPRQLLLALLRPGSRVCLHHGLVLFDRWRGANPPQDPLSTFRKVATSVKNAIRRASGIEVSIRTGGKGEGYWWELETPVASNVADACEWLDGIRRRLIGNNAATAQRDLGRGLHERLFLLDPCEVAEVILLASPVPADAFSRSILNKLQEYLYEHSLVLAAATTQLVCFAHAKREYFGWPQASRFVRSWVSELGCLSEAINATKRKLSAGQRSTSSEELEEFVVHANAYRDSERRQHAGSTEHSPLPQGYRKRSGHLEAYVAPATTDNGGEELGGPAESLEWHRAIIAGTAFFDHLFEDMRPALPKSPDQRNEMLRTVLCWELCEWLKCLPRPLVAHPRLLSVISSVMRAAVLRNRSGGDSGSIYDAPPGQEQLARTVVSLLDGVSRRRNARRVIDEILHRFAPQRKGGDGNQEQPLFRLDELFPELADRHRLVGGRSHELERLNDFVASPEGGYIFVTGPSGMGKTALLWQFAQKLETDGTPRAVHFIDARADQDPQRFFLENLFEQLASFHGHKDQTPKEVWKLPALCGRLLGAPLGLHRKTVVIIDGLDELLPAWSPDRQMFPSDPPAGVKVVLSARTIADKDWPAELGLELPSERVIALGQLSDGDVADVVRRTKIIPRDVKKLKDAADRLFTLSEGAPFYLRALLDDLHESGGNIEALDDYPIGEVAYLAKWWTDGCKACPQGIFANLMAYLALAQAPLHRDVLVRISKDDTLRGGEFLALKKAAARYMVGSKKHGYALSHGRIAEFALNQVEEEIDKYKGRFADFCRRWNEPLTGAALAYALRHGPTHLAEAGRYDDLRELLFDFEWMQAKLDCTDSYRLSADYDLLRGDGAASRIQHGIRLASNVLVENKSQLAAQIFGRLLDDVSPEIQALLESVDRAAPRIWFRPLSESLSSPGGSLLHTFDHHRGYVCSVAVTPDGQEAASAALNDAIRIWDPSTGMMLRCLGSPESRFRAVATDGRTVIAGSDFGTLTAWDRETGQIQWAAPGHEAAVYAVGIAPNSSFVVSGAADGSLGLWDLAAGGNVVMLEGHVKGVSAVAWLRDSQRFVSASWDGSIKVWDLHKRTLLQETRGHSGSVEAIAVTEDGERAVSASADGTARVWDTNSWGPLHTLVGHSRRVCSVAVTPDGHRAVTGGSDKTLRIWDIAAGRLLGTLRGHSGSVDAIAITHNGKAISGSGDDTLKVWDLAESKLSIQGDGKPGFTAVMAMTANGRHVLLESTNGDPVVWDLDQARGVCTLILGGVRIAAAGMVPDGSKVVIVSSTGNLEAWDLEVGARLWRLPGSVAEPTAVVLANDGRLAVAGTGTGTLTAWDIVDGSKVAEAESGSAAICPVVITPDGQRAICQSLQDGLVAWDLQTGRVSFGFGGHVGWIDADALPREGGGSRDVGGMHQASSTPGPGVAAAASNWKIFRAIPKASADTVFGKWAQFLPSASSSISGDDWTPLSGNEKSLTPSSGRARRKPALARSCGGVARCTHDGWRLILPTLGAPVEVWDLRSGRRAYKLEAEIKWGSPLAITEDGCSALSVSSDRNLVLWDLRTGQRLCHLGGIDFYPDAVAIAPRGQRAVLVSPDGGLVVWDLERGHRRRVNADDEGFVDALAITRDGKRMAAALSSGTLRIWELETGEPIASFTGESRFSSIEVSASGQVIVATEDSSRVHLLRLMGV